MTGSWANWVALAAGSGVAAGIANQALSWLRESRDRGFKRDQYAQEIEHQRLMLLDQRRHEALLRAEHAHFDARATFLPPARNVHSWLYGEWIRRFGDEIAYSANVVAPVSIQSASDAMAELGQIAVGHPTRSVRRHARHLDAQMDQRYNIVAGGQALPTREDLEAWLMDASRLIDEIHEFDSANNLPLPSAGATPDDLSV